MVWAGGPAVWCASPAWGGAIGATRGAIRRSYAADIAIKPQRTPAPMASPLVRKESPDIAWRGTAKSRGIVEKILDGGEMFRLAG